MANKNKNRGSCLYTLANKYSEEHLPKNLVAGYAAIFYGDIGASNSTIKTFSEKVFGRRWPPKLCSLDVTDWPGVILSVAVAASVGEFWLDGQDQGPQCSEAVSGEAGHGRSENYSWRWTRMRIWRW